MRAGVLEEEERTDRICKIKSEGLRTLLEGKDEPATEARCSSSIQAVGEKSMKANNSNLMSALYIHFKLYSTTFRYDYFAEIGQSK